MDDIGAVGLKFHFELKPLKPLVIASFGCHTIRLKSLPMRANEDCTAAGQCTLTFLGSSSVLYRKVVTKPIPNEGDAVPRPEQTTRALSNTFQSPKALALVVAIAASRPLGAH